MHPRNQYAMRSLTGSVTTKHELGLKIVDFFDYQSAAPSGFPQFVHNYFWRVDQNLFNNGTGTPVDGSSSVFCRPTRVCVWVLPQARGFGDGSTAGGIQTNAEAMYTVNCQVPGIMGWVDTNEAPSYPRALALNTQVTNVLPQFDTKWKKVLTCNIDQTFKSAEVEPVFSGAFLDPDKRYDQCLFQMSIVNPQTGEPYQTGNSDEPDPGIRVKVEIWIDNPIQMQNQASLAVFRNELFTSPSTGQNEGDFTGTAEQYCQMDLYGSVDKRR